MRLITLLINRTPTSCNGPRVRELCVSKGRWCSRVPTVCDLTCCMYLSRLAWCLSCVWTDRPWHNDRSVWSQGDIHEETDRVGEDRIRHRRTGFTSVQEHPRPPSQGTLCWSCTSKDHGEGKGQPREDSCVGEENPWEAVQGSVEIGEHRDRTSQQCLQGREGRIHWSWGFPAPRQTQDEHWLYLHEPVPVISEIWGEHFVSITPSFFRVINVLFSWQTNRSTTRRWRVSTSNLSNKDFTRRVHTVVYTSHCWTTVTMPTRRPTQSKRELPMRINRDLDPVLPYATPSSSQEDAQTRRTFPCDSEVNTLSESLFFLVYNVHQFLVEITVFSTCVR